eukprot:scaffold123923_cov52-Phaeocystis_antarctica.AAC.1
MYVAANSSRQFHLLGLGLGVGRHCGAKRGPGGRSAALGPREPPCGSARAPGAVSGRLLFCHCQDGASDHADGQEARAALEDQDRAVERRPTQPPQSTVRLDPERITQ